MDNENQTPESGSRRRGGKFFSALCSIFRNIDSPSDHCGVYSCDSTEADGLRDLQCCERQHGTGNSGGQRDLREGGIAGDG